MSSVTGSRSVDRRRSNASSPGVSWPYVKSSDGTWEYEWGGTVPGARDLTLSDVYAFPVTNGSPRGPLVIIPIDVWEADLKLSWCAAYWDPLNRRAKAIEVPLHVWQSHDEVIRMDAPELSALNLIDSVGAAEMAGCTPRSIANYLTRELMPLPVVRLGGSPAWPRPLLRHWLATRPGRRGRPLRSRLPEHS